MKKIFLGAMLALTLLGCGSKDDSIIVYTNSGSNGRSEFLTSSTVTILSPTIILSYFF